MNRSRGAGEIDWEDASRVVHRMVVGVQAGNEVCCGSNPEELRTSKTSPLRLPKADAARDMPHRLLRASSGHPMLNR